MTEFHGLSEKDYEQICFQLNINPDSDIEATNLLSKKLIKRHVRKAVKKLDKILSEKIVLIFGAGPSLLESINILHSFIDRHREKIAVIGIDGATQALIENQILVDIVISDLDGGLNILRKAHDQDSILVIHGHGDNIPKIKEISKLLKEDNIIGSTQVKTTATTINFGGFTDGDRGVFLASNFPIKMILLVAFDFGAIVGRYSKPEIFTEDIPTPERKQVKFTIAKKLLEELIQQKPHIRFHTFLNKIESIESITEITINNLEKEISK